MRLFSSVLLRFFALEPTCRPDKTSSVTSGDTKASRNPPLHRFFRSHFKTATERQREQLAINKPFCMLIWFRVRSGEDRIIDGWEWTEGRINISIIILIFIVGYLSFIHVRLFEQITQEIELFSRSHSFLNIRFGDEWSNNNVAIGKPRYHSVFCDSSFVCCKHVSNRAKFNAQSVRGKKGYWKQCLLSTKEFVASCFP